MRIGILGSGKMGSALGTIWTRKGHRVMFSYTRDPSKLSALVAAIGQGARAGTPREAAEFGEVVVLAVPYGAVTDALAAAGAMEGKILFSCVNALKPDLSGMVVGTTTSAAEEVARAVSGAQVVEAFPAFAETLHSSSRMFNRPMTTSFYCGNDGPAKEVVAGLLHDLGVEPVDAGPLRNARYLEPAMMLLVQLAYAQGMGPVSFALLRREGMPPPGGSQRSS